MVHSVVSDLDVAGVRGRPFDPLLRLASLFAALEVASMAKNMKRGKPDRHSFRIHIEQGSWFSCLPVLSYL